MEDEKTPEICSNSLMPSRPKKVTLSDLNSMVKNGWRYGDPLGRHRRTIAVHGMLDASVEAEEFTEAELEAFGANVPKELRRPVLAWELQNAKKPTVLRLRPLFRRRSSKPASSHYEYFSKVLPEETRGKATRMHKMNDILSERHLLESIGAAELSAPYRERLKRYRESLMLQSPKGMSRTDFRVSVRSRWY